MVGELMGLTLFVAVGDDGLRDCAGCLRTITGLLIRTPRIVAFLGAAQTLVLCALAPAGLAGLGSRWRSAEWVTAKPPCSARSVWPLRACVHDTATMPARSRAPAIHQGRGRRG